MGEVSRAKAHLQSSAGHDVQHRVVFGNPDWVGKGQDSNSTAELDVSGPLRDRRQEERWIRNHAVLMKVMFGNPIRVEAKGVCSLGLRNHLIIQATYITRTFTRIVIRKTKNTDPHDFPYPD